uniref:hypothetical protein n=1 Tax=Hericium alpestre TaxID=135208 RepID=UPI0024353CA5|nr:hypothetical protein QEO35_mgp27 [Hericium alpestre]WEX32006.1 hypothetical protein [Hericium alpestre]
MWIMKLWYYWFFFIICLFNKEIKLLYSKIINLNIKYNKNKGNKLIVIFTDFIDSKFTSVYYWLKLIMIINLLIIIFNLIYGDFTYKNKLLLDTLDISNLLELFKEQVNGLDSYPLNLLFEVSTLVNCSIIFIVTILNVFIAIFFKENDIFNYLPKWLDPNNNKIGKILKFIVNRYIIIWYTYRKFILIWCLAMLFLIFLVIKLCLFIILNGNT